MPDHSLESLLNRLPNHLRERLRILIRNDLPLSKLNNSYVLYWMRTAMRLDENPALDVAIEFANELGVAMLIYQCLPQRYPFASDRHHAFLLQGARDVQRECASRGFTYGFQLERSDKDTNHLRQLVELAAITISEDMPTSPTEKFLRDNLQVHSSNVLAVDTACVVPMQVVGKAFERAFEFRNRTKRMVEERISLPWPVLLQRPKNYDERKLPFEAVNLQHVSLSSLIRECDIDHSVAPVADTIGGSSAGINRWESFRKLGLNQYAAKRNDPLKQGNSRLSAYLHYGMVSPMRLAREARAAGHEGAEKFIDELLIWRELAYGFCFYRPEYGKLSAIPEWALHTLSLHENDRRPVLLSWEQLARGQSTDMLWDVAQKSLLIHGELHNNVRMTWGKSILRWTKNSNDALRMLVDLNHRYALDGRDPSSYGGILWCLGQFDRPFQPEQPIFGTVRPRSTAEHITRLNVNQYQSMTISSRNTPMPTTAIIGAGISGCFAARTISDHGWPVKIFEKSRGHGGRMATRRLEDQQFDHGAQYFTVRDAHFRRYVDSWVEQGIVAIWPGPIAVYESSGQTSQAAEMERFVGVPAMNAIAKYLTSGLDINFGVHVAKTVRRDNQWILFDSENQELGSFDRVIAAIPAPQVASLAAAVSEFVSQLIDVKIAPCWAAMLCLPAPLEIPWSGAFINAGPLRWAARNQTKPGRNPTAENLVLHASEQWTTEHLELEKETVTAQLAEAFWDATGISRQSPKYSTAHRWRYSIPIATTPSRTVSTSDRSLIACGDWAGGPRVEGAFLSGMAAAGLILGEMADVLP